MARRWALVVAPLALFGSESCTQPSATAGRSDPSATPAALSGSSTSQESSASALREPWAKAVAVHNFGLAAERFDAEHPAPASPTLRFVRARIAAQLADHAQVLTLVQGLENELPQFAQEVLALRAEAQAEVGPFDVAAQYFLRQGGPRAALRAAQALLRAEQFQQALTTLEAAIKKLGKEEAEPMSQLRRAEADALAKLGRKAEAVARYRNLALQYPTSLGAQGADEIYETLSQTRLSRQQRYERAEAFTDKGDFDAMNRELAHMDEASGAAPAGVQVLRTRAWANYKSRRDYAKAAELFTQTAQLDPAHRTQDLFFAARALSRANQDELAIERYLALAQRDAKSSYAEQARYFAARLYSILGRWREAALAYNDYERRYRRGRFINEVYYERAVVRLALGEGKSALADLDRARAHVSSDTERALLDELRGVALAKAGQTEKAAELWRVVMAERPLSFAAALSAERLRALGLALPPALPAAEAQASLPSELTLRLPDKVQSWVAWGFHDDAARELYAARNEFEASYQPRGEEALCEALGLLTTSELRFNYAHRVVSEKVLMRAVTANTRWQWDCIYPRPYGEVVAAQEERQRLPAGLLYAIMRQESAFKPLVRSPVGAVGLMQLMPTTAERAAAELQMRHDPQLLESPPYNIELGAFYVGKMLRRFDGNVPLAAAAYNAGPTAVQRWLKNSETLPLDLWVARIPYEETRGYVQRVVGNWVRYRYLSDGLEGLPTLPLALPTALSESSDDY